MEIDNELIISRIKSLYSYKTDRSVAEKLSISPQKLSNWKKRDGIQWDIVFRECEDMDFNFLIKGTLNQQPNDMDTEKEIQYLKKDIKRLEKIIESQEQIIESLKEKNRFPARGNAS